MEFSSLITMIGVLVALTNLIVEVLKKVTWSKLPTNALTLMVALALTILLGLAYFQMKSVPLTWYLIISLVVTGFLVAYAAMFGFDKLKEILEGLRDGNSK